MIHIQLWLLPKYICIIHFRRFYYFANFAVSRQNNLIYDAEEKNGLFAATSATRVIVFAVRPFALFGRVKGKPAAISSHNRVYTVPCSVFLCPIMCRAASCFLLFSLCLLLPFVLNCDAKVQRYLLSTKQKTKNLCLFNVLQQIRLFLPKFIHILSTKSAKCAIYKANLFVFRLITYVHYIITNNNAIFV